MTTYKLYELRTKKSKSQEDIAAALGTSQQQYSKYERGVQDLTGMRIIELCKIMIQTSSGGWAEKRGSNGATREYTSKNPAKISWDLDGMEGFYDSTIIYLAVTR